MNDNKNGAAPSSKQDETAEPTQEQKDEMLKQWSAEVAMVMNHLRRLYDQKMVLTFIARNPADPTCFTRLSEEQDWNEFLDALALMGPPIPAVAISDTVGNA